MKQNIILNDLDFEILYCLRKFNFLHDYHIAVITGVRVTSIKDRLIALERAGYVGRKAIKAGMPACNWITKMGLRELGLEAKRTVRVPCTAKFEHDLGIADLCVWLTLPRKNGRYYELGEIISERDFYAVREMQVTGSKSNGQNIMVAADRAIHAPDGYIIIKGDKYIALEFERTPKSLRSITKENVERNAQRFYRQFWAVDDSRPVVRKSLEDIQQEYGKGEIVIIDISAVRRDIQRYAETLPSLADVRKGRCQRNSGLGAMSDPIPLNRLPVISRPGTMPVLEKRSVALKETKTSPQRSQNEAKPGAVPDTSQQETKKNPVPVRVQSENRFETRSSQQGITKAPSAKAAQNEPTSRPQRSQTETTKALPRPRVALERR